MALIVKDRVQETTSTTGTGTLTLSGAVSGYQTFSSAIGNGNTTYYSITDGVNWEVGIGTVAAGTLSRDTVLSNSLGTTALITFAAGVKNVFVTYPADKAVTIDGVQTLTNKTLTSPTLTAPVLGTPASGTLTNCTFPTLNQNTTGTAANVTGIVAAVNGGTGQSSYAVGDIVYASTTTALSKLADVATGNALISGGVGVAPAYGKIGLTTHVSGALPVANGGTNATTASITSFNNITGYTATGATGTTSTNLVFSTSPTLVTPVLGTPTSGTLTSCTGLPLTTGVTGTLPIANGGTNATATPTLGGVIVGTGTAYSSTAAGTSGQVLISNNSAAPTWATLTLENLPGAWVKKAVDCATTAALTINTAQTTIDGVTLSAATRVLVKDQAAPAQNGIYTGLTTTTWVRATDSDTAGEIAGAHVNVDAGTVNGGLVYDNDFKSTDTLGTTGMPWYRVVDTGYTIPATQGGTGQTSYAVGDLVYALTTTALSKLADVATGNALISGGVGVAPSYGKVGLTTHISGTLAVANGGTGVTTSTGSGNTVLSTSPTLVTPVLGTPTSGTLTNCTFPTLNQNTTGSSGSCTGNSATATALSTASGSAPSYSSRAWVNFNASSGTPTIQASGNVSSITDGGVGRFTVNFTTAMQAASYSVVASCSPGSTTTTRNTVPMINTLATGSVFIDIRETSAGYVDATYISVAVFR